MKETKEMILCNEGEFGFKVTVESVKIRFSDWKKYEKGI